MIHRSFIIFDRISEKTETKIWRQGIHDWNSFLDSTSIQGISKQRKIFYDSCIAKARQHLIQKDMKFFHDRLSPSQMWRIYDHFKDEAVFLDIETSEYYGDITVIGMYDGYDTKIMVKGFNLDKDLLLQELSRYKMLITFNGASFDIPVIERYFNTKIDLPNFDLRFACQRVGLTGGLKHIERLLGIKRPEDVASVEGSDAIHLWNMYKVTGDREFLDRLVRYNEEDIINLKPLAGHVVGKLKARAAAMMC